MSNNYTAMQSIMRNWRFLLPSNKRVGYIGWTGHGNLGDEAMYLAFKKLFCQFDIAPFKFTDKIAIFEEIRRKKLFQAVCLGGGTLINTINSYINPLRIAQERYCATFVFGAGVRDPSFWNTSNLGKNTLNGWIDCLNKSFFVGVRGPLSQRILSENGFCKAEIIGDPTLSLAKNRILKKEKLKSLGINIGISAEKTWGDEQDTLDFVIRFTKILIHKGWHITFVPVCNSDIRYIEEAAKKIDDKSVSIFYGYNSIKKTLDLLEKFDVFIGEKLHSVILSMCTYTPSIMLEYRPKCIDFMMSMNMEEFNVRIDRLSFELLINLIEKLSANTEYYQSKMAERIDYFKLIQKEKCKLVSETIIKRIRES